jgi:hypothetical protein
VDIDTIHTHANQMGYAAGLGGKLLAADVNPETLEPVLLSALGGTRTPNLLIRRTRRRMRSRSLRASQCL